MSPPHRLELDLGRAEPIIETFVFTEEFANLQEAIEEEFDELIQDGDPEPQPTYHTTSITDTSLQLAFSQVLTSTLMASTAISGILDSWVTVRPHTRCLLVFT